MQRMVWLKQDRKETLQIQQSYKDSLKLENVDLRKESLTSWL